MADVYDYTGHYIVATGKGIVLLVVTAGFTAVSSSAGPCPYLQCIMDPIIMLEREAYVL